MNPETNTKLETGDRVTWDLEGHALEIMQERYGNFFTVINVRELPAKDQTERRQYLVSIAHKKDPVMWTTAAKKRIPAAFANTFFKLADAA